MNEKTIMTHVYAVHVLDSLLGYCQTELFASFEDAKETYTDYLSVHHNYIKHVHSTVDVNPNTFSQDDELPHLYYEGDESNIKILIEKIQIK